MNMRERIAMLETQVEDLKAKIIQQDLDYSNFIEVKHGQIEQLNRVHEGEVELLESEFKKKLESSESNRKYYQDQSSERQAVIESLHDILDVIPGVLEREKVGQYGTTVNSPVVRLASVLAKRSI